MVENWIKVFESSEEYKSVLVVELLEQNDLHPVMYDRRDDQFMIGRAEVFVAPEEAEQARKVLSENSIGTKEK